MSTGLEFQGSAKEAGRQSRWIQTSFVQLALFFLLLVILVALAVVLWRFDRTVALFVAIAAPVVSFLAASAVKVANEWERSIVLRLGGFNGLRGPGLFYIIPVIDRVHEVTLFLLAICTQKWIQTCTQLR